MQYKTIILELIRQQPQLHEQLRRNKLLLETMNEHAGRLKARHLEWLAVLTEATPESEPSQLTRTAFELALSEWESALRNDSLPTHGEALTLDDAMAFLHRHSLPE